MMSGEVRPWRWIAIVALFFATRIPLLYARLPFFDELFTLWISRKPVAEIIHALHHDSGPPLYYLLVHAFGHGRWLSLIFSTIALAALLRAGHFAAAALIAVFPPSVLFAVDARSYALCAMFVTLGILALHRDKPFHAALAFVFAAYSHYYGVLFFPLVRRLKPAFLYLLFLPGLFLALHQPREAMGWMQHFAYPDALFARPPLALFVLMALLVAASLIGGAPPPSAAQTLIPSILSLPIYVPLRFESVIATPLMMWIANGKRLVVLALGACFASWTILGIVDHAHRPTDDYFDAAVRVQGLKEPVVASGYLYLEAVLLRSDVQAFPPEQAQHPGWRAFATSGSTAPSGAFVWIGERDAPELAILRQTRTVEPVYVNARAMIARVR